MLSRRTRAAASKEAAAAALTVPSAQSLDDSYCASPKRKDCKLDISDDGSVKLEMKLTVSITAAPAKRPSGGTKASPTAKGKRQPPAITRFFSPQAKSQPSQHPANCVHNDSNGDLNAIDEQFYNDNGAIVSNGGSPRSDEPQQLKQQANADAATNDVTSNAICELVSPQKAHRLVSEEAAEDVLAGKYDGDVSFCSGSAPSSDEGPMFMSPVALNKVVDGKQSTPHRMVINASPVKPPLRYSKHTVSDFSQLKIGDASPTNKKSSNKRDKKTRRRLEVSGTENAIKPSADLPKLTPVTSTETTTDPETLQNDEVKESIDTKIFKKPILNSSKDPTAQQNTTNNIKTVPRPHVNKTITEYFPIRRSGRKTKQEVEQEYLRQIEIAIERDVEEGLLVVNFKDKGRGLVADRDFARGEFVVEYVGDLIDQTEAHRRELLYARDVKFGCYMYYFKYKEQQWCVDATAESGKCGRLLNHSRNGNLITKIITYEKRPRLILIARDDIKKGTELTYDYGDRRREALLNHPWLAY